MSEGYIRKLNNGKEQIKRAPALCMLRKGSLPQDNETYTDIFDNIDSIIRKKYPKIKQGAFSNVHGDWYEWFLAIEGWNYCVNNPEANLPLLLPNISSFDVAALYEKELHDYIVDLRQKVEEAAAVQLITSNPDFVILNRNTVNDFAPIDKPITELTPETLEMLNGYYLNFAQQCSFEDLVGYISVKTSLRPDRRLQLSHEGSLMKALYVHLQTREWILNPPGLKYYGMATKASQADIDGLKTVATHSITTVQSIPEPAVDHLYTVNSSPQAREAFSKIL